MRRNLAKQLKEYLNRSEPYKNVLLLEGARQVGKSYLVADVLKDYQGQNLVSINLEESPIIREKIDECPDFASFQFLTTEVWGLDVEKPGILFIDEAQESRQIGSFVRFMKENWADTSVVLTGSSMARLFDHTRVPVGRVEYLRLYPYCFSEFLRALEKEHLLDDCRNQIFDCPLSKHTALLELYDAYLQVGGLPSVVEAYKQEPHGNGYSIKRQEIYISQKDDFHRKETGLKHHLFESTIKAVARNLASPFKLTSISDNHRDAKQALSQLTRWHIVLPCEQQGLNPTSNYSPKVYLYDIGLAKQFRESVLPKLSTAKTEDSLLRNALGGLVENAVFISLLSGKGFLTPPTGWKKDPKNPVEIDFILNSGAVPLPIEVKAAKKYNQRFGSSLLEYLHLTGLKRGVLVSAAPYQVDRIRDCEIINLPLYYCLASTLEQLIPQSAV
ncbi:MAG: ATP-binding protein [Deltaproteobacteria bacterium]|nr:ATP-binding protein [Deltaproteobacteria bacterium]